MLIGQGRPDGLVFLGLAPPSRACSLDMQFSSPSYSQSDMLGTFQAVASTLLVGVNELHSLTSIYLISQPSMVWTDRDFPEDAFCST